MKIKIFLLCVLSFIVGVICRSVSVPVARAQSIGASPSAATPLSGCPVPAPNFLNFCQVTNDPLNPSGAYVTSNGAAYFLIQKAGGQTGVQTFSGRSGNVMPVVGDYSFSMIGGALSPLQIPTHTCTMTTAAGTNAAVVTLTGCK